MDGIELTWATNVMSYFLLSNLLLDILLLPLFALSFFSPSLYLFILFDSFLNTLKASAPSRIVNVASNYAGDLDTSDVQFKVCLYLFFSFIHFYILSFTSCTLYQKRN